MKKIFRDYAESNPEIMKGFTLVNVEIGINAEETGMYMELERAIDNVTIGIDVIYNPDHEENETELMISEIIKASEYYRTRIYKSSTKIGIEIGKLENKLKQYVSIGYSPIKNGNAGKIHKFYRLV